MRREDFCAGGAVLRATSCGPKYDFDSAKPVPAGSFVTHYSKKIRYDGAKGEECVLEIVGMGPATSTNAAER